LRLEATRRGRSQQELIREAVDRYLGLSQADDEPRSDAEALIASGRVLPARSPFRDVQPTLRLPRGVTTQDLLDREDRV
jgi:hypothetical protein